MSVTTPQYENPWPHRLALMMVCATFPLVWVGGLVTTYDAGMAVPDWPSTYGYNLFLYPLSTWIAGPWDLFIEHGHRLLGAMVGLIAIGFVLVVWSGGERSSLRWLSLAALAGVCFQGLLGGMRVRFDARTLAMIHGCVGPAFFAFAAGLTVVTSRQWRGAELLGQNPRVARWAALCVGLAYLQLVLGAQLRHVPIDAAPSFFRAALYFHLLGAAALLVHVIGLAVAVLRLPQKPVWFAWPSLALVLLVIAQLLLGAATWVLKYGWPQWLGEHEYLVRNEHLFDSLVVTGHVATGSLILAISLVALLFAVRHLRPERVAFFLALRPLWAEVAG